MIKIDQIKKTTFWIQILKVWLMFQINNTIYKNNKMQ